MGAQAASINPVAPPPSGAMGFFSFADHVAGIKDRLHKIYFRHPMTFYQSINVYPGC
jgi:hypothetical protein